MWNRNSNEGIEGDLRGGRLSQPSVINHVSFCITIIPVPTPNPLHARTLARIRRSRERARASDIDPRHPRRFDVTLPLFARIFHVHTLGVPQLAMQSSRKGD